MRFGLLTLGFMMTACSGPNGGLWNIEALPLQSNGESYDVAFAPDGTKLFVAVGSTTKPTLSELALTGSNRSPIVKAEFLKPTDSNGVPPRIFLDMKGNRLITATRAGDGLYAYDATTSRFTKLDGSDDVVDLLAVDGEHLYASSRAANTFGRFDLTGNSVGAFTAITMDRDEAKPQKVSPMSTTTAWFFNDHRLQTYDVATNTARLKNDSVFDYTLFGPTKAYTYIGAPEATGAPGFFEATITNGRLDTTWSDKTLADRVGEYAKANVQLTTHAGTATAPPSGRFLVSPKEDSFVWLGAVGGGAFTYFKKPPSNSTEDLSGSFCQVASSSQSSPKITFSSGTIVQSDGDGEDKVTYSASGGAMSVTHKGTAISQTYEYFYRRTGSWLSIVRDRKAGEQQVIGAWGRTFGLYRGCE